MSEKFSNNRECLSDVCSDVKFQLKIIRFAGQLWKFFRVIIRGTREQLSISLNLQVSEIVEAIDVRMNDFFVRKSAT